MLSSGLQSLLFRFLLLWIHALGSDIGVVNYSHVRRTSNQPAHILVRQAQNLVNDVIWIEETSCCIQQALIQDVFGL